MANDKKMLATIPEVPNGVDPALRRTLTAIKEALDVRLGRRGDPMEEGVTKRDLVAAGLAKKIGNAGLARPDLSLGDLVPGAPLGVLPPVPIAFQAEGVFGGIVLSWELPQNFYDGHAHTEIWRSATADPETRVQVGIAVGSSYFDVMSDLGEATFYYWIRFASVTGRKGPFSQAEQATKPEDVEQLLIRLSGEIDESILSLALADRIGLIDAPASLEGSVAARIKVESDARAESDESFAYQIEDISAQIESARATIRKETETRVAVDDAMARDMGLLYSAVGENTAAIKTEQETRATADSATAKSVQTVQTALDGSVASIQAQAKSINGLSAQYTLTTDVNGYVSGFGTYNNGKTSDFAVTADRFWIAPPNSLGKIKPFIVQNGSVYIDTAMIREASIQQGKIGPISFGKITDAYGLPVTTVGGKLKATSIETDQLWTAIANARTAFIGSASIGYAAIGRAHIQDLAVDTLKIAGNAVTVPQFASASYPIPGGGAWTAVISLYFLVETPGWLFASSTGFISYGRGFGDTQSKLRIHNTDVSYGGGTESWVNASHSGAIYIATPGVYGVFLDFKSPSGKGSIQTRSLFAMMVKR